jgi:hypothetical protein
MRTPHASAGMDRPPRSAAPLRRDEPAFATAACNADATVLQCRGAIGVRVARGCWSPNGKESPTMSDPNTVIVKDGGSNTGVILGIIAIIIVLALGWYFLMGPGAGTSQPSDVNVDVNLPSVAPAAS